MINQKEVARRAGISLKTVSRVINDDPLVNAETRARVQAIVAELGYQPSVAARMIRSKTSGIVGFLADEVATTYTSFELVRGAQAAAWDRGKQLMLFNVDSGGERERQALDQLASFRAEAIIYATFYHHRVEPDVIDASAPMVLLNCFDEEGRVPAFVPDDRRAAYEITAEMIRRGARNPVFLNVLPTIVAAPLRAEGFLAAGREAGLDLSSRIFSGIVTENGVRMRKAYDHALRLLTAPDRPDAILCGQDSQAMEVYLAASEAGLKVGRDVAVASFDNEAPICDLLRPGLTTMALPYFEMGHGAMQVALERKPVGGRRRIPCMMVDRQSLANDLWQRR